MTTLISLKGAMLVWVVLFVLFVNTNSLPREEYLKLKNHLKLLNKPGIKSIETKYGDILDCVDINKQPAFDNPLLKNHTIQMRPSSFPKRTRDEAPSNSAKQVVMGGVVCPEGTVPIRRTLKQDLLRSTSLDAFGKKFVGNITPSDIRDGHHWATVQALHGTFFGTQVTMNVWGLQLSNHRQFSLQQLWVMNGPLDHQNTVEAGWMVNPGLYGDQHTRLFVYWTADGYRNGCFNILCPGFVHVGNDIAIGAVIEPLSTYNGPQYETSLLVFKDPITQNWWLTYGPDNKLVGYWPKNLFTSLQGSANAVHWGGEIYNPTNNPVCPPMGSGHFPSEGEFRKSCFARLIKVVDGDNNLIDAPDNTYPNADMPQLYKVDSSSTKDRDWRRYFYFGGPGGMC